MSATATSTENTSRHVKGSPLGVGFYGYHHMITFSPVVSEGSLDVRRRLTTTDEDKGG